MATPTSVEKNDSPRQGMGCLSVLGLMLLTVVISVGVTLWIINVYLFPKQFDPVELSAQEQQVLERKLESFEGISTTQTDTADGSLEPLPYSEEGADRTISLSERELNGMLAHNTDLADKLAIDLSDKLVSARLRIPMDPDFPIFGGRTLRGRAGLEISYSEDNPVVVLKGVSVMGVPVPNAWLGGLKNIDLVGHFGQSEGFWKTFSAGIDHVQVVDGALQIKLKE